MEVVLRNDGVFETFEVDVTQDDVIEAFVDCVK